jgi:hypothetical protein
MDNILQSHEVSSEQELHAYFLRYIFAQSNFGADQMAETVALFVAKKDIYEVRILIELVEADKATALVKITLNTYFRNYLLNTLIIFLLF